MSSPAKVEPPVNRAYARPLGTTQLCRDVVMTTRSMRRVGLLLTPARRRALAVAFEQLRTEVAPKLANARDAAEVCSLLTEMEPQTLALFSFIGSQFQGFEAGPLFQSAEQGIDEFAALRIKSRRRLSATTLRELDAALAFYLASLRVSNSVDFAHTRFPADTARAFTQVCVDSDALLATVAFVLEGTLRPRSTQAFAAQIAVMHGVCLLRYAIAREVASMAPFPLVPEAATQMIELRDSKRVFKLRRRVRVELLVGDGGVTAILHALDLVVSAPTPAEAITELGERFAERWDALEQPDSAPLTLDAQALRWHMMALVSQVEPHP